jgi:DNA invertase Pin-like site-specific DNA recombinase
MPNILYARTSTEDQSLDRQLVGDYDKVFTDQVSGSLTSREGLDAMFDYVRTGDTVHVHHTDRLTRGGVTGMEALLAKFRGLGVHVKFGNLPETIYADKPISSQNQFIIDMLASLDRMQRGKIREVAAQGIAVAKSKDLIAKAEGRIADVKYKGREATYDTTRVRLAILATKAYGSLNKQLLAINSGYVTATDEKIAKAGGALINLTRNVLHRQRQAMQLEGLLK